MQRLTIALIFTLASLGTRAQHGAEPKLEEAIGNLCRAMLDGDRDMLEQLTDDKLSYGHSTGKVETKAQFTESLAGGSADYRSMDVSGQQITVKGNTAIVRQKVVAAVTDEGRQFDVTLAVMMVWIKDKGAWKLLARHAAKL